MIRRKLLIALVTAGLYALLTTVASAEMHRVQVTLVTGEVLTVTVDVPPGTPVSEIQIPGLPAPVASITDLGPVATPTPVPTPELPVPTPQLPSVPTPSGPSQGGGGGGSDHPSGSDEGSNGGGGSSGNGGGSSSPAPAKTPSAGGMIKPPKTGNHSVDANSESLIGKVERAKTPDPTNPTVNTDGSPSLDNPTISLSQPGPARIGVPNFFIEKFRIPPFLLPIYQAAGIQYGVRWEVLAAINEIETDYGRNLDVSSAGAVGWMQFMPATWKLYGVDANKDGFKDPNNPADAIFAAARYLRAAGASQDLRKAIFAYNHAGWYVDSVLLRARVIGGLPAGLVGSLTGLTQGRFPVLAHATYANSVSKQQLRKQGKKAPAYEIKSNARRNGIKIFARQGAPVIAVNDGKVVRIGRSKRLGRFVTIQDVYGNVYTYGRLKTVARVYPTPKPTSVSQQDIRRELNLDRTSKDRKPTVPASKTTEATAKARKNAEQVAKRAAAARAKDDSKRDAAAAQREKVAKQRLFANPARPAARDAGGDQQIFESTGEVEGYSSFKDYLKRVFGLDRKDVALKQLRPGSQVAAGTILGRIGRTTSSQAPHMLFEIRPAGRGAPRIDPKPILDGWKLLESTAIYRAAGKNPFFGPDAKNPSIGQILLMSKEALSARVLADPRIDDLRAAAATTSRPARSTAACWRRSSSSSRVGLQADGHVAEVRPQLSDDVGQRVRAHDRHGRRHRRRQRHPDPRPPGQGLDHRARDPAPADAPGHDEAAPDHQPDDVRRHRQHVRDGRPRRPHPRRLPAAVRRELQARQAGQRDAASPVSGSS